MLPHSVLFLYANFVRYCVFGMWFVKFATEPLERLADLPPDVFLPPFPMHWMLESQERAFISHGALVSLRLAGILSCAACFWRRLLRWSGPICFVVLVTHQCIVRGFGHVNHAEIPILLAALVFAVASWSRSGRKNPEPLVISLLLCLTYTLIAAHRIAYGGVEVFLSRSMVYWSVHRATLLTYFDFSLGKLALEHAWFARVLQFGFPIVTIIELLAPFAVINRRFKWLFLVSMLGFHVGVLLTMNICFWENTVLLVVLFAMPWPRNRVQVSDDAGRQWYELNSTCRSFVH